MADTAKTTDLWLECDCPSGGEFSLRPLPRPDATVTCPWCDAEHEARCVGVPMVRRAGEDGRAMTDVEWEALSNAR